MANYSLVINSKFSPFTFDEMLKPVALASEAQEQAEEAYAKILEQAEIWGNKANQQTDPIAYAQYKRYADRLARYAEALSKRGLSQADRMGLREMRKDYAKDIIPIQEAYAKRLQDMKAQQEVLIKDPTHIFGKYAAQTSLDEYLKNSNLDVMSQNYSGAMLAQQVGTAAQALAKEARQASVLPTENPYYLKFVQKYGYSPTEVLSAIQNPNDPNANAMLVGILRQSIDASGIKEWASPADFQKMVNYGSMGLWGAVGQDNIAFHENVAAVKQLESALAEQRAKNLIDYKMQKQAELAGLSGGIDPDVVDSAHPLQYKNFTTSGILNKNGNFTDRGLKSFNALLSSIRQSGLTASQFNTLYNMKKSGASMKEISDYAARNFKVKGLGGVQAKKMEKSASDIAINLLLFPKDLFTKEYWKNKNFSMGDMTTHHRNDYYEYKSPVDKYLTAKNNTLEGATAELLGLYTKANPGWLKSDWNTNKKYGGANIKNAYNQNDLIQWVNSGPNSNLFSGIKMSSKYQYRPDKKIQGEVAEGLLLSIGNANLRDTEGKIVNLDNFRKASDVKTPVVALRYNGDMEVTFSRKVDDSEKESKTVVIPRNLLPPILKSISNNMNVLSTAYNKATTDSQKEIINTHYGKTIDDLYGRGFGSLSKRYTNSPIKLDGDTYSILEDDSDEE